MEIFIFVLIGLLMLAVCLGVWRFFALRSKGTQVILRRLPASGTHGWRHGTFRYDGDALDYFKLRSLAPAADITFRRQDLAMKNTRPLSEREQGFMSDELTVVSFEHQNSSFEAALDRRGMMALTAWVESAPDIRQERPDFRRLRDRVSRLRKEP